MLSRLILSHYEPSVHKHDMQHLQSGLTQTGRLVPDVRRSAPAALPNNSNSVHSGMYPRKLHRVPGWKGTILCITFGSPFVGNAVLANIMREKGWDRHFLHVVSRHDIVPRLLISHCESENALTTLVYPVRPRWLRAIFILEAPLKMIDVLYGVPWSRMPCGTMHTGLGYVVIELHGVTYD